MILIIICIISSIVMYCINLTLDLDKGTKYLTILFAPLFLFTIIFIYILSLFDNPTEEIQLKQFEVNELKQVLENYKTKDENEQTLINDILNITDNFDLQYCKSCLDKIDDVILKTIARRYLDLKEFIYEEKIKR